MVVTTLRLAGYALGALGAVLLFVEFFQQPSYISYEPEFESYNVDLSPQEVTEHTWIGRIGALLLALAFALEFFAVFLG
ncbi:hypothetical protein [Halospeciosus flavus]|uniref:Uncharacterized protein n=1 Tax=Halospeciosus flavus TaxID=3032283 RepID=A0ABD5Z3U3_9EURY|nr:hypothetical protein [Halospeciosus flavus]